MNNTIIKFRAWLIKKNQLVIPSSINWNKGYGGALEIFVDNPKFDVIRDVIKSPDIKVLPFFTYINHTLDCHKKNNDGDDFILEQYTRLKDTSGVEIYEGDLLWANNQHRSYEYTVIFYEGSFIYRKGKRSQKKYLNSKSIYLQNLEVIGNIHENKELLK